MSRTPQQIAVALQGVESWVETDGTIVEPDGLCHNTIQEFMEDILGFCGCGQPDKAREYVRGALNLVSVRFNHEFKDEIGVRVWLSLVDRYFNKSAGAEYFMWYVLDAKGFLEHGGCVPGWLTESGKQMLYLLTKYQDGPAHTERSDS